VVGRSTPGQSNLGLRDVPRDCDVRVPQALKAEPNLAATAAHAEPPARSRDAPLFYRLRRRCTEYAWLMRLDRPVGTWLLLWPALWALWVAGAGRPAPRVLIVFVLGVIVMRAAGCVINDFADRDIDPYVRRTRDRPLAARRVTPLEALVLFALLATLALYLVTRLDRFTIVLGLIGGVLTVSYPFLKRFFRVPQLYLGISFGGWSVLMAFAAQSGALPRVAWVLYIAAVLWTCAYDTIYAMVDREDDLAIGVQSSAILFADLDRFFVGVLQLLALAALVLAGRSMHYGRWYNGGLCAAAALFLWQQWLMRTREPQACLRAFLNNQYVGLAVFVGILLQYMYG
jgi:4-hydroxybenzoate polyprenyltransferase